MRSIPALSLAAALLVACQSESGSVASVGASSSESITEAAAAAPALDVDARLEEVRRMLADGQAREVLALLDEVHAAAPELAEAWYLRGDAMAAVAATDPQPAFFYSESLGAYEKAKELGHGVDAVFAAARAARMNLEGEKSLRYAREGLALLEDGATTAEPADRILVQASFDAYVAKRQNEEDATELFTATHEAIDRALAEDPNDLWALDQLANLYLWEGRPMDAADALERRVLAAPADEAVHTRFVEFLRTQGDGGVEEAYGRFLERYPDSGLGVWYLAQDRFARAVKGLLAGEDTRALFAEAEATYRRCRETEPAYEGACKGYEVMCRDGVGWCLYNADELDASMEAFLSMNEVVDRGIEYELQGSLLSGIQGLLFIADKHMKAGPEPENLVAAGDAFDTARRLEPTSASISLADIANNAGFLFRDAGVALETRARRGERDLRREDDPEERAKLEELVRADRELARDVMDRCYAAYVHAAELAPDDVRVVNDAALVIVYHVQQHADQAERMLLDAIAKGAAQKEDPDLSEEELDYLLEAWGDAHQNMGLLELTIRGDAEAARTWLEKAFEIGPRPRIDRRIIQTNFLPACDRLAAGEELDVRAIDPRLWPVRK